MYTYLEPLYNDNRRIRLRTMEGHCVLTHIDEIIDDMLRKDYLFDVAMPHIPARWEPALRLPPQLGPAVLCRAGCCRCCVGLSLVPRTSCRVCMSQSQAALGIARAHAGMQMMPCAAVPALTCAMRAYIGIPLSASMQTACMLHHLHMWHFVTCCGTAAAAGT